MNQSVQKNLKKEVLKARIKNLIEQRRKLREHFKNAGLIELEDKEITSTDKKFLQKAVEIINKHLSDTSFSVEMFAGEVSMSRRNLDRKLIALTGESPSDLIKRKQEFLNSMKELVNIRGLDFILVMFTDIMKGVCTMLVFPVELDVIKKAFNKTIKDNQVYLPGILSRKKQVIPPIGKALT